MGDWDGLNYQERKTQLKLYNIARNLTVGSGDSSLEEPDDRAYTKAAKEIGVLGLSAQDRRYFNEAWRQCLQDMRQP